MELKNISLTTQNNLCCGCGICVGICPKQCVHWRKNDHGLYEPLVDTTACIKCELCRNVCPGLEHQYPEQTDQEAVLGDVLFSCNAWSRIPQIRRVSASGGVVTTLVWQLLQKGDYDTAFLVDSYDYHQQLVTRPCTAQDMDNPPDFLPYPKSRYLPVSHENAVSYIKHNRKKKVVIVGTSCAVRGILSVIEQLHLPRENYLLIGLFCDRVFTYNVVDYYSQPSFSGGKALTELHFKNKESGGWPGNMKFFFSDGSISYQDKSERTKVKDYFMPERCLYCIDKLNVCADISTGDNYTNEHVSQLGSNSVIIRTQLGLKVWEKHQGFLEYYKVSPGQIQKAQFIDWRLNHLCYGKLKEQKILRQSGQKITLNKGVRTKRNENEYYGRWHHAMQMIHIGEQYSCTPQRFWKKVKKITKKKNPAFKIVLKMYFFIVRHLTKI